MINLVKLEDKELIQTALIKDELYKAMVGAYFNNDFDPQIKNTAWFLSLESGKVKGLSYITGFTSNCVCYHGGIYKEFRGKDSLRIFLETLAQVRKIVNKKIIFTISSHNKQAQGMAKKAGYIYKTTIQDGFESGPVEIYAEE